MELRRAHSPRLLHVEGLLLRCIPALLLPPEEASSPQEEQRVTLAATSSSLIGGSSDPNKVPLRPRIFLSAITSACSTCLLDGVSIPISKVSQEDLETSEVSDVREEEKL